MKNVPIKGRRVKTGMGAVALLTTTVPIAESGWGTKMFLKMVVLAMLFFSVSTAYADSWSPYTKNTPVYTASGLGSREAEEAYHQAVAAWMDATGGKQGIEPGAISYEYGPIPLNTAFKD